MHIWVGNLTMIGSDNGLSPSWRQAIYWTNAGILLIGRLGTKFSEILIQLLAFIFVIQENAFESVDCEMAAILSRHQCYVWKGRDYHLPFLCQHWFYSNGFGGANKQSLTFRFLWDVAVILKVPNSSYRTVTCEIAPRWMPQNITNMISSVNGFVLADPACL